MSLIRPTIAIPGNIGEIPPQDRTPEQEAIVKLVEEFNSSLSRSAARTALFDPIAAKFRFYFLVGMSFLTLVATIALLVVLFTSDDSAKAITAGVALVGVMAVAGFVNPLQTVERDTVFRRWSDMITLTFLTQAADPTLQPSKLTAAADAANARFTALGTAYAGATSKTLETLAVYADAAGGEDEVASDALSITNPGEQTSKKGASMTELLIVATGGKTKAFVDDGTLPKGLTIASDTGVISGEPAGDSITVEAVKITVKDSEQGLESSATFKWAIEEAQ